MSEELKPSSKMKSAVANIEKNLGIKCKDKSYEGCSKFISEHLEASREAYSKLGPSEKQLSAIKAIQARLGVQFTGSTRVEASKFLDENLSKLKDGNQRPRSRKRN